MARLIRVLRITRLARLLHAARTLGEAMAARRFDLGATLAVAGLLLLVTSTLLYVATAEAQPEVFGGRGRAAPRGRRRATGRTAISRRCGRSALSASRSPARREAPPPAPPTTSQPARRRRPG